MPDAWMRGSTPSRPRDRRGFARPPRDRDRRRHLGSGGDGGPPRGARRRRGSRGTASTSSTFVGDAPRGGRPGCRHRCLPLRGHRGFGGGRRRRRGRAPHRSATASTWPRPADAGTSRRCRRVGRHRDAIGPVAVAGDRAVGRRAGSVARCELPSAGGPRRARRPDGRGDRRLGIRRRWSRRPAARGRVAAAPSTRRVALDDARGSRRDVALTPERRQRGRVAHRAGQTLGDDPRPAPDRLLPVPVRRRTRGPRGRVRDAGRRGRHRDRVRAPGGGVPVDPEPAQGRGMSGAIAGLVACFAAVAAFGSIGLWRKADLLGTVAGRAERTSRPTPFGRIGRWPVVRRVEISDTVAARLGTIGARWDPREVVGAKVVVAATTLVVVGAVVGPMVGVAFAAVAWRVPDLVLARTARRTTRAADREIPFLLDLLAVATSAGLPPQLAFRRAVEGAEGPLAESLRGVVNATDLGGRWRTELRAAGERLELPDLRRLIGALARTEAFGSSLSEEVSRLATDVREARRTAATQRARTAPVKMLFPLVFLVLPAFLLLTVVPVLLTTVRSIA